MFIEANSFVYLAGIVAVLMLIWDTIEVGRNDAANIVNAVFGSRVLRRKTAVRIAGLAVIFGAWASSAVIETARKGIFDPSMLSIYDALAVYIAVYITDTVMLYSFSAFGMPISTTAGLVFALLGGSFALGGSEVVHWEMSMTVISAIIISIFISGAAGFLVQRALRGAIGKDCRDFERVQLHGPWIAGAMMTGLIYFMLMKGMENIGFVSHLRATTLDEFGTPAVLIILWAVLTGLVSVIISFNPKVIVPNLFSALAVLGMLAIAFAFGQNDLANCASPGVASWMILRHGEVATKIDVPNYLLLGCGMLLALGMMTKTAQRVTRAEVNTGSQGDVVRLYAPRWCIWLARLVYRKEKNEPVLAPEPTYDDRRKLTHYDALRAAVITSVSASIIAFASGRGLPVSTTYVAFAAVVATGWADRIFQRGDAHIKLGRTIWVVFGWFFSALIAAVFAGISALMISRLQTWGILLALAINQLVRWYMKHRANLQEERLLQESIVRKNQYGANATDLHDDDDANL